MARIFIDGFESGGADLFASQYLATVEPDSSYLFDGGYYLNLEDAASYAAITLSSALSEVYSAFLFRCTQGSQNGVIAFYSGSTPICHITTSALGHLNAYLSTSTNVGESTLALSAGNTYHIEVHFKMSDTVGEIAVKVNGISVITYSGDTKPGTQTTFDSVRFGLASIGTGGVAYDNIILDSSAWVGKTYIQALLPTAAGATQSWLSSGITNWSSVDDIPTADGDFIYTNTVNQTDTYVTSDIAGAIGVIKAVQVQARVLRNGLSTPTNLQLVVRSGGTDYTSASIAIPTSYASVSKIWETNPATSSVWTESTVNAMEIGVKSVA